MLHKEKNWAATYVDSWILADTNNYQESIAALRSFIKSNSQIKIEGALTFWEESVLLTAKIVDAFNFTGIPYTVAKRVRDKNKFRQFCKQQGLPTPNFKLIQKLDDLKTTDGELNFPLVIKPIYGSSSAFVVKVENQGELLETYNYIKNNITSHPDSAEWDSLEVLVEEYIDGDEVDIDMLLQNGKVKFYSITDNARTKEPFFIETGFSIPSSLPLRAKQDLIAMAEETLEKLGVQHGCIQFEAKSTKNGPVPIEINLRMGGDEVYSFMKSVWNVDFVEEATRIALGQYLPKIIRPDVPRQYLTGSDFLSDYSGIIVKLDIDEKLKKHPRLEEFHFYKKVGDPVLVPPEGYEYLGWVTVSGENLLDAQDNLENIMKYVKFEVAKFDSTSFLGKTLRKNRFSYAALNKSLVTGAAKIERIRRVSLKDQRNLHIGIACNIYPENQTGVVEGELTSIGQRIQQVLKERGYRVTFFDFNNVQQAINQLIKSNVDLVFNVCERINDSSLLEPHVASIFDILQIPYTGSNPFTLALSLDKIRVKKLLTYHGIPTPKWDYAYYLDDKISDELQYPLIVKPGNTDDSIGITNDSIVTNPVELKSQLKKVIHDLGRPALVEEYIEGDEYDVSILGSEAEDLRVLPLQRSIFSEVPSGIWHIYSFSIKYENDPAFDKIIIQLPAKNISKKLESLISEIALDTYNILDCHDYGRIEIRVDKDENPYVLELNPNPSIGENDGMPSSAKLVGLRYGDLLEDIISMAIKRYQGRPPYYHLQATVK